MSRNLSWRHHRPSRVGLGLRSLLAAALLLAGPSCRLLGPLGLQAPVRVYAASRVVTLDPDRPSARAVAVLGDRIVGVGDAEQLVESFRAAGERVVLDERFAGNVLIPGLVEPHLHPYIGALLLPMAFVTPHDWEILGRHFPGVRGRDAYLARLRELEAELTAQGDDDGWLDTWGYHHLFHGALSRTDLDAISSTRPILVWHRSFHEIYLNTPALEAAGIDRAATEAHPAASAIDWERGHFYETGLALAIAGLQPRLAGLRRYLGGLAMTREMIHRGGITTVSDGAFGTLDLDAEWRALRFAWRAGNTPFRTVLLPDGRALGTLHGHPGAQALIETLPARSTGRLVFPEKSVKLFADGAFYSQLMCLGPPGYLDGHECEWLMEPAELEEAARHYWRAGYQIHVHANGDEGVRATLDILEKLQREHPREDHRFALHHLGYSTDAQSRRMAELGAIVSANPYYLWALADKYAEVGLGPERAAHMVRIGSLLREGVRVSFHSDFTMAPAEPLRLASIAATRIAASGRVMAPEERITPEQALRAVTLDAAHLLRMEHEIGSIAPGKKADFTVLARDPLAVPPEDWADIEIWGTVFEGEPWPIERD